MRNSPLARIAGSLLFLTLSSAAALFYVVSHGWTLYYGDSESHLDIARRVVDSRTPGYDELGTVWLPLTHVLMLPFVASDGLWRSGLAGAIPSACCFVLAGVFLFAAAREVCGSTVTAGAVLALFALNPNLLYLQSIPMTEAAFATAVTALLFFTVRFRQSGARRYLIGAALANLAATLIRYDGWFLIPFAAAFFLLASHRERWRNAVLYGAIASLGPLYWLAHNAWYFGNPLDFYNGPYSAIAIQGQASYPGHGDWPLAWRYFRAAAGLCSGGVLPWLAAPGAAALLFVRRAYWPVGFLALAPLFYVWSVHSANTPIFVPGLPPHSYYNVRYGLAALPLLALCAGALTLAAPVRWRPALAFVVAAAAVSPWLLRAGPGASACFRESEVNSVSRRAWTRAAAATIGPEYHTGTGIFSALGDLGGIYREAGIPFREVLNETNGPAWDAAVARPDLFLREEWAVAQAGDTVWKTVRKPAAGKRGYHLLRAIDTPGAPVLEIYRRN